MKQVFVPSEGALNQCCVCLEPIAINSPSAVIVDCSHEFWYDIVVTLSLDDLHSWLTRNTNCPLCKVEILNVEEYPNGKEEEPVF